MIIAILVNIYVIIGCLCGLFIYAVAKSAFNKEGTSDHVKKSAKYIMDIYHEHQVAYALVSCLLWPLLVKYMTIG